MTEQTVNIPLLRKAVEWAEAEAAKPPELCEWVQGTWVAPADESQDRLGWGKGYGYTSAYGKAESCGTCFCIAGYTTAMTVGLIAVWAIEDEARARLGLTERQAERLFDADNDIAAVRRIAEDIAGERL